MFAIDFPLKIRGSNQGKFWCILLTRLEAFYTSGTFKYQVVDSLVDTKMDNGRKIYDKFLQVQKFSNFSNRHQAKVALEMQYLQCSGQRMTRLNGNYC